MNEETALTVQLPDGRHLAYSIFGDRSFKNTIFYFHGFPGSRLEVAFADQAARDRGLTVVGIDRPGFGQSTFSSTRQILEWPADVNHLADHLGVAYFSVFGISGGCPYALACALKGEGRVRKVAIVSGLGSTDIPGALRAMHFFNRRMLKLAATAPSIAGALVKRLTQALHQHPGAMLRWLIAVSPPSDKAILRRPDVRRILTESFREGLRGNGDGTAYELRLIAKPWGFEPRDVACPVTLWHGTADDYVPLAMGQHHAKVIPHCQAHIVPDQGHFMVVALVEQILTDLSDCP